MCVCVCLVYSLPPFFVVVAAGVRFLFCCCVDLRTNDIGLWRNTCHPSMIYKNKGDTRREREREKGVTKWRKKNKGCFSLPFADISQEIMETLSVVEGRLGVSIDILGGIAWEFALANTVRLRADAVVMVAKESSDTLLLLLLLLVVAVVLKVVTVGGNIDLVVVVMVV